MSTTAETAKLRGDICPPWCDNHASPEDGDFHKSARRDIGSSHYLMISTGSLSGRPELFIDDREGVAIAQAQEFANAILTAADQAQS